MARGNSASLCAVILRAKIEVIPTSRGRLLLVRAPGKGLTPGEKVGGHIALEGPDAIMTFLVLEHRPQFTREEITTLRGGPIALLSVRVNFYRIRHDRLFTIDLD